MSIQETYEWAKDKMEKWSDLTKGKDTLQSEVNKKVIVPPILRFENMSFVGDVALRDGDLFFHFYPTDRAPNVLMPVGKEKMWVFGDKFSAHLADSFKKVFRFEERLFWDFVPELNSWVVRAAGFGDNPLHDIMIEAVLVDIKSKNE